jgi:hypothetical protein
LLLIISHMHYSDIMSKAEWSRYLFGG